MFWIRFGIIAASLGAAFISGWVVNGWKHEAARAAELSGYVSNLKQSIRRDRDGNSDLALQLEWERKARDDDDREFQRRLNAKPKLVTVDCPHRDGLAIAAGGAAGDVPVVRLTPDAVRLWNDAIGARPDVGPGRGDASRPGAPAAQR